MVPLMVYKAPDVLDIVDAFVQADDNEDASDQGDQYQEEVDEDSDGGKGVGFDGG